MALAMFLLAACSPSQRPNIRSLGWRCTNGTGGNSGGWSGSVAGNTFDIVGWTDASGYKGDNCAKLGTGSARGALTTHAFGTAGNAVVTFRAGAWDGASEQTTLLLKMALA